MMQFTNLPSNPESQSSSPEDQAFRIRLSIIPDSVAFLEAVIANMPEMAEVPQPQAPVRIVPHQVTNPVVEHALRQPTLAEEAYKALDEIHGGNNDHQAAA
jgi:hypothetical protein